MIIHNAKFTGSFVNVNQCPAPTIPEYAFIGRSNVGKSSLINLLVERKALARISNKPGKTQHINHFYINDDWYLVDLPGYGYAKVSKTSRKKWETFIKNYLNKRTNLQCVFLLIDSRIPPQKIDLEFANWMGEMRIPFLIIFTKCDKNKPEELERNLQNFNDAMLENWENLPQSFRSSSVSGDGREEILDFIDQTNKKFIPLTD